MAQDFHLPPAGFGPGSQPQDDSADYMEMPQEMRTYAPHIPDLDGSEGAPALALLAEVAAAADRIARGAPAETFDLTPLDAASRALLSEVLGEGEVAMKLRGIPAVAAQESVFAGVWALKGEGVDQIEVAPVPTLALARAFAPVRPGTGTATPEPQGLASAPAILVELLDKSASFGAEAPLHVINLTLLPHSEPDLAFLDEALGEGAVTILSRGYGNCRIGATATPGIWRVQFFNSMDTLILDTFEVTSVPEVAVAAVEDLRDSAERIRAVIEAIQ